MKRTLIISVLLVVLGAASAGAQQLTRFAVVDLPRVYTSFFRDSRAVRDFEERSARVQAEIDRMNEEIQTLRSSKVDAERQGNTEQALRLESEIYRKSEFLREYFQTKTAELEDQRKRLAQSNTFLQQVLDEIRYIAESEGYSMVLNLKENTGIIWYSPTVDITDKVIQNLMTKAGR
ncbi:OmpH family outer membrane protein [Breznakiella homolactica]|uniref:OmpH family outer membrane protein n=1 Tax=Breznakiella homolactica TaxID=2798577 RepID=A0A7T7XKY7_9SPIR|nr:OmpH family outer membrane protein [Breznakiella homolactica]QQO08201.1 OmpH family outer membrane protein [Breznakiella homolactica]